MPRTYSKLFIAAGWVDKIAETYRELAIIRHHKHDSFIVRDEFGYSPFEMGVGFGSVELAKTAIDDLLGRPTARGLEHYPDTGGCYEGVACVCKDDCPSACKGGCGCRACLNSYGDFLSCE